MKLKTTYFVCTDFGMSHVKFATCGCDSLGLVHYCCSGLKMLALDRLKLCGFNLLCTKNHLALVDPCKYVKCSSKL